MQSTRLSCVNWLRRRIFGIRLRNLDDDVKRHLRLQKTGASFLKENKCGHEVTCDALADRYRTRGGNAEGLVGRIAEDKTTES